jgi:hypothetical protein
LRIPVWTLKLFFANRITLGFLKCIPTRKSPAEHQSETLTRKNLEKE